MLPARLVAGDRGRPVSPARTLSREWADETVRILAGCGRVQASQAAAPAPRPACPAPRLPRAPPAPRPA